MSVLWRGKFAAGIVALSMGKTAESANTESGGGIPAVCMEILGPATVFLCVVSAVSFVWLAEESNVKHVVYGMVLLLVITSTGYYLINSA